MNISVNSDWLTKLTKMSKREDPLNEAKRNVEKYLGLSIFSSIVQYKVKSVFPIIISLFLAFVSVQHHRKVKLLKHLLLLEK